MAIMLDLIYLHIPGGGVTLFGHVTATRVMIGVNCESLSRVITKLH